MLDLANPDCHAFIRDRLDALLGEHDIAFLKWDHNRDLVEAGHAGRPGVHAQTLATYRLLDELRGRHPGWRSRAAPRAGAGSTWGSFTAPTGSGPATPTTPWSASRSSWTQLLVPPELVGSHVGPPKAHTTGRVHGLAFRVATALFGHFGIEWDIASASEPEQAALAEAIAFYKRMRPLLHSGQVVRADHPTRPPTCTGWWPPTAPRRCSPTCSSPPRPTRRRAWPAPGLDPGRAYRVEPVPVAGEPETAGRGGPGVAGGGGVTLGGRPLAEVGLPCRCSGPSRPCCST